MTIDRRLQLFYVELTQGVRVESREGMRKMGTAHSQTRLADNLRRRWLPAYRRLKLFYMELTLEVGVE